MARNLTPDEAATLRALELVVRRTKPHDVKAVTFELRRGGRITWTDSTTRRHLATLQELGRAELTDGGWRPIEERT